MSGGAETLTELHRTADRRVSLEAKSDSIHEAVGVCTSVR